MNLFKKVFSPKRMLIINLIGVVFNLLSIAYFKFLGTGRETTFMFSFAAACFVLGALMNLYIISIEEKNKK